MLAFTAFAFPSTSGGANRTTPNRLDDIINVKDFGAVGNNSNNDTTAIQAAVNWQTSTAYRGKIVFPPGHYRTTAPITLNADNMHFHISGSGPESTHVEGNFSGPIFSRQSSGHGIGCVIEDMKITNNHASGKGIYLDWLRIGRMQNLLVQAGAVCIEMWDDVYPFGIYDCDIRGNDTGTDGTIGLLIRGIGVVQNCDIVGCFNGIRGFAGLVVIGSRIESNLIGIVSGLNAAGAGFATTTSIIATGFENNYIAADLVSANNLAFQTFTIQGQDFAPQPDGESIGNSLIAIRMGAGQQRVIGPGIVGGEHSTGGLVWPSSPNDCIADIIQGFDATGITVGSPYVLNGVNTVGLDIKATHDFPEITCTIDQIDAYEASPERGFLPQGTMRIISNSNTVTPGAAISRASQGSKVLAVSIDGQGDWRVVMAF